MAVANALAFLLYLSASALMVRQFVNKGSPSSIIIPTSMVVLLAIIFHATDMYMLLHDGWVLNLSSTLSIAAWLMATLTFIWSVKTPLSPLGMIIYPLVAFILIFRQASHVFETTVLSDPALEWHILLSLTAYSLFTLAAIQAIVLAIQEKHLRQRHVSGLIRKLPPLESMEKGLFQLLASGFILLSAGLLIGALFIEDIFAQHLSHKTLLSLISWCVFALLLWQRWRYGLRGKTALRWTLIGFSLLALAYIGTKFVLEYLITNA